MAKILVVDDRPADRQYLSVLLSYAGHDVVEASGGRESLNLIQAERPDLIITDILMPSMDGFEFVRELRADPRVGQTPVVFCSANYEDKEARALADCCSIAAILAKPCEPEQVLATVSKVLRQPAAARPAPPEEFDRAHLRLITDKLHQKVAELEVLNQTLESRVEERTHQLEEANKELESFAYSVSHDLRAPLRGIAGFGQILMRDYAGKPLDETGMDYIRRMGEATTRMGQLIDDLLELSRVSRTSARRELVDLSALATAIVEELRAAAFRADVQVRIQPGLTAVGDARLLRIALENLLGNAWKFTSKTAGPCIDFELVEDNGQPVYVVRDNGVGFDMAFAGQLFAPFQRLHRGAEFEGTGIGLATVQRIIHRHWGQIWAESAPGRGASFYFTLGQRHNDSQADLARGRQRR